MSGPECRSYLCENSPCQRLWLWLVDEPEAIRHNKKPEASQNILKSLNWLGSPSEVRKTLPDYGSRRHIRRLGSHCMIHMIFPTFATGGSFYLDEYPTTSEKPIISHHEFSVFMLFVDKAWSTWWTYKLRSPNFCRLPLNYIVLEYNKRRVMVQMLQLRFEFANGGKLCWGLLLLPQSRPRGIEDRPPRLSRSCYSV